MKLTKKQSEIITKVKQLEQETKQTIYFMYNELSKKIHAVTVNVKDNSMIDIDNKGILCTYNVAATMEDKEIIVPEVVGKYKRYSNSEEIYDFILCKLAV
jgi:hypothetical protein